MSYLKRACSLIMEDNFLDTHEKALETTTIAFIYYYQKTKT